MAARMPVVFVPHGGGPWPFVEMGFPRDDIDRLAGYLRSVREVPPVPPKALLVILFFMHMLWEANWKYVLTIPASMMSIFLLLMLVPDIGRRTTKYAEERWLYAAEPKDVSTPGESAEELGNDHDHSSHGKKSDHAKH